jgi:hypothetical protein
MPDAKPGAEPQAEPEAKADAKVTAFRFSDEELELLGVIQGHTGIRTRMEALRAVLRYYVEAEGLQVSPDQAAPGDPPPKPTSPNPKG